MFEEIHQGCAKVRMKELIQWNLNWNDKRRNYRNVIQRNSTQVMHSGK